MEDVETESFPAAGPEFLGTLILEGTKTPLTFSQVTESVAVLTGDELIDRRVEDLQDSFNQTANVQHVGGNAGNNGITIRGLNSEGIAGNASNNAPLTSIIIDGATQSVEATRRGARALWDMDQIEIYRGPQSTLQGRGSIAGAVILQSADPTFTREGAIRLGYGGRAVQNGASVVSGPLSDSLAARLSAELRHEDVNISFSDSIYDEISQDRLSNLRAKLLWQPVDLPQLSMQLTYSDTFDRPGVRQVNGDDFFDREFATGPTSALEIREARNRNLTLETRYAFDNGMELTHVAAFVDSDTTIRAPEDQNFQRDENRRGQDMTQDLRLTFGSEDTTLSGVAGLFYGWFTLPRDSLAYRTAAGNRVVFQDLTSNDRTESVSLYGDVRWRVAPRVQLGVGGRWVRETVIQDSSGVFGQVIAADGSVINPGRTEATSGAADFETFLPRIGAIYEITDTATVSLNYARGYRSGFTEATPTGFREVAPEFLDSYELAYKTADPDGNWRLGASAFYSEYTDVQIANDVGSGFVETLNAGAAVLYGAEIEGSYGFDNGVSLWGSLGLLETRFEDFEASGCSGNDCSGNIFPEAPELTASLGIEYLHSDGWFAGATFTHSSAYFSTGDIENTDALKVDAFSVVDAQAGYEWANGLRLTFWVDNLLDAEYETSLGGLVGGRPTFATIGDARTIGVELLATF